MEERRVVDVTLGHPNAGYGSGYLVTNRLVLTAGHVVAAGGCGAPCNVRRLSPLDKAPASVLWVSKRFDAALVELKAPVLELPSLPPMFATFDPERDFARHCRGVGFPRAQMQDGADIDFEIFGQLFWVSRLKMLEVEMGRDPPSDPRQWEGLSGAALFVGETLIGLVTSYKPNFRGRHLQAMPAMRLLDEPEFCEHLAGSREAAERLFDCPRSAELAADIAPLLCRIDRAPQLEGINLTLNARGPKTLTKPMIFAVDGVAADMPDSFIERLSAERAVMALSADAEPAETIVPLHWPTSWNIDPRSGLDLLFTELTGLLSLVLPAPTVGEGVTTDEHMLAFAKTLRCAIDAFGRPVAFWWTLWVEKGDGHAEMLRRWLDFWCAMDPGLPILLFMVVEHRESAPDPAGAVQRNSFRGQPKIDPAINAAIDEAGQSRKIILLDEFDWIATGNVPEWISDVAKRRPKIPAGKLLWLQQKLQVRMGGEVPMIKFVEHASDILGAVQ